MGQQWACHRSGDCCRHAGRLTMTHAEQVELEAVADRPLLFEPHADGRFVDLLPVAGTSACPLLGADGLCTVYAVRPFNCRRWGCFRPTTSEPFLAAVREVPGTAQLMPVRITEKPVARQLARMQRHAQPWALAHGWGTP
jgi:Fe-S-cluster containining protein